MDNNEFYTLKGYQLTEEDKFTHAMEDYLEMICRILKSSDSVRITELSYKLNVRTSSASKMVRRMNDLGYVVAEKYGTVTLTEKGKTAGSYLLYRHNVINSFLRFLNNSENELEETEKIEHFLSRKTIDNMNTFLKDNNIAHNIF